MRISSGEKMVWHKTIGSGPTKVIVIHGWFWDHRGFTPIFDCLDAASYTFAFIDIRGYGNSRNVSGGYTIGEVATDAIAAAAPPGRGGGCFLRSSLARE